MRNRLAIVAMIAAAAVAVLPRAFWPREPEPPVSEPTPAGARAARPPAAVRDASSPPVSSPAVGEGVATGRILERLRAWRLMADPRAAIRELDGIVGLLDAGDVKGILESLLPEEVEGRVGTLLLEKWLSLDPDAATAWLLNREVMPGEQVTLVAKKLLEVPGRLERHLDGVKDEGRHHQLLGAAGFEAVATDPRRALIFAEKMHPGELRSALIRSSAFEWGRRDPVEAKRWVETIQDADTRERLAAWGAKGWAEKDARGAAEWLVSSVKSPEMLGEVVPAVVRCWAERDPAAAAEWVSRFPEGPVREQAMENLLGWAAPDAGVGSPEPSKAP